MEFSDENQNQRESSRGRERFPMRRHEQQDAGAEHERPEHQGDPDRPLDPRPARVLQLEYTNARRGLFVQDTGLAPPRQQLGASFSHVTLQGTNDSAPHAACLERTMRNCEKRCDGIAFSKYDHRLELC
jgi:hypothetical protein